MSEAAEIPQEENINAASASAQTAGQMLCTYREQAGVTLEAVAELLKVNPQKIRALEQDDLSSTQGTAFARALASKICRHFGVDPQPVLAKMTVERPRIINDDEVLRMPFVPGKFTTVGGSKTGVPGWGIALAVLGVLAALVLFFLPAISAKWPHLPLLGSRIANSQAVATVAEPVSVVTPINTQTPAAALAPGSHPQAGMAASEAVAATSMAAPASSAAAVTEAAPAAARQGLLFKASGDTWIQVRDAVGRTIFERLLVTGDEQQVPVAQYPVRVTVGKVENVQMLDRGQAFDLAAIASTGVARFELQQ